MPALVIHGPDILAVTGWAEGSDGAAPALAVEMDPARVTVADLDPPPLRARAVLRDGGDIVFSGTVQSVRLGDAITMTLEI